MTRVIDRQGGQLLSELLGVSQTTGEQDVRVTSCCNRPQFCQPGDVFVAMEDGETDGLEGVFQAVQRGAIAVVCEQLAPVAVPQYIVQDSRSAFGKICQALSDSPTQHLQSVAVTGTHGKSVTSLLMVSILDSAEQRSGFLGSFGLCDGANVKAPESAQLHSVEYAKWLSQARANGCTHAVMEIDSPSLAQQQLAGLKFNAAIFTDVTRENLHIHHTVRNYRATMRRLVDYLKPGGFAVLNMDDTFCRKLLPQLDVPTVTYSIKDDEAQVTATVIDRHRSEQTFLIEAGEDTMPVRTRVIGDQHISNCLAATAAALVMGIDLPTIASGLEAITEVHGHLERLECGQDFSVYVDGCRSPESLRNSLETLREVADKRLIVVMDAVEDLTSPERACLGRILEDEADEFVIT
ncbi:MAG: hypothetical protein KDA87_02290, partial [Planctomycetales bacterium]|nr:hypothetical protein [Planctomycetales bacterium]